MTGLTGVLFVSLAISTPDRQRTLDQTAIVNHRFCKARTFETSFHSVPPRV